MSTAQMVGSKVTELSWQRVRDLISSLPEGKMWGVPRGGAIVAGLSGRGTDKIDEADFIVDDIIDSGKTMLKYKEYNIPFVALIDKRSRPDLGWVVFPWEKGSIDDLEETVRRQLQIIGEDQNRDGLIETPMRVAKSIRELTFGYKEDPGLILNKVFDVAYDEMVVLKGIEFWSLCEHHMLPFHGTASIAYIPNGKVVGISKLARLVHCFSRRLQVQERLTQEIAEAIQTHLNPLGVGVKLQATHLCMALRGVRTPATMITSKLLGAMKSESSARNEFLKLAEEKSE